MPQNGSELFYLLINMQDCLHELSNAATLLEAAQLLEHESNEKNETLTKCMYLVDLYKNVLDEQLPLLEQFVSESVDELGKFRKG